MQFSPEEKELLFDILLDVKRIGGELSPEGNAVSFYTEKHRDEAAEFLIDKWGPWYFESVQVSEQSYPRILLVAPDSNLQAKKLAEYLRLKDFSVEVAIDALQALELLPIHKPDTILLDTAILWGGADGLLSRLQDSPELSDVPVILLKNDDSQNKFEFRGLVSASFRKPFILNNVKAAIRDAYSRARNW